MTTKKHYQSSLSQDQISTLTEFVIDMYGVGLSESELNESISVVLEDVSGIELESSESTQYLMNQIRNQYYG
jgi:hypothetical protein